jgi:glutaredoxin
MLERLRAWLAGRRPAAPATTLVLYTKADCPLCERMKAELARARLSTPWRLEEVDVDGDPELRVRYGLSVPVLLLGARVLAKGRTTADELARRYERVQAEIRAGSLPADARRRESRDD